MNREPTSSLLRLLDAFLEGRTSGWFVNVVVIPSLVLLAFVLPPLSIPQRVLSAGYTGVSTAGGYVSDPDGTLFSIPAGATQSGVSIKLSSVALEDLTKSPLAQDLPAVLDPKSPLYEPSLQGPPPSIAMLSIPIPEGADPWSTLDVYGYVGEKWTKLPFQLYSDPSELRIDTFLMGSTPQGILVAQTQAQSPAIGADISGGNPLPPQASAVLAQVNPLGLTIADGGGIAGSVPSTPETSASSPYQVLPTVSDVVGGQLRSDLVDDMVTNPDMRKEHVQALVDLAVEKLYPGLNIDYQGVTPDNKNDFTSFVLELAQALHAKNKILSVTLGLPKAKTVDAWDTGPYDWATIGREADIVRIPLPTSREDYAGPTPMVQNYMQWAVGRIDRYKLELAFSALGRDEFGTSYAPITFANAIRLVGQISLPDAVEPGDKVTFDLPNLRQGGLKYDAPTGLYSLTYNDDKGQAHTVWLETADSLAKKTSLALEYNLRGVDLSGLVPDAVDPGVWQALGQFRESQTYAFKANPAIVWRVNGQTVGKSPLTDPKFAWTAPDQAGDEKVEAFLSFDDGQSTIGSAGSKSFPVAYKVRATPTPSRPAVATAPTPKPAANPPSPFAGQNNFSYGAQLNWTNSDNNVEMGQLNQMGFKWAKIQVRWCDFETSKGVANLSQIDRLMAAANSHGIKVLFSVVCAPGWSRADRGAGGSGPPDNMQDAADFMGGLAGIYCGKGLGAIEVWNEHNLLTEWHGKQISAALYMDMLKRAYQAIHAKCNSIIVVSGAPTPTGVMSDTAIDDVVFLRQLYQNGLKQYSDAIGAHPSGFGNAPDVPAGTPNATGQFQGHRSFYFRGTMDAYHQVMVENADTKKQIWPTEFGWGVDPNPKPGYEYERTLTPDQQAAWLVKAYQSMKSWGYVGAAFVWNLDFTDMNNETGAFHILGRPAFDALAGMAK